MHENKKSHSKTGNLVQQLLTYNEIVEKNYQTAGKFKKDHNLPILNWRYRTFFDTYSPHIAPYRQFDPPTPLQTGDVVYGWPLKRLSCGEILSDDEFLSLICNKIKCSSKSNQLWLLVLRNNYSKIARTDLIQTLQSYKKLVLTPSVFLCVSVSIQHLVRAKLSSPTAKGGKESISWVIILSSSDETKDVVRYGRKNQFWLNPKSRGVVGGIHPLVRRWPTISYRIILWSQKFLTLCINIPTRR